jgi:hypothetical protein
MSNTNERETMNTITYRYEAVNIKCEGPRHYTVKNTAGRTISFTRLRDAKVFVTCNWSKDLIEAQFAA